jgi:hypothetical protein
VIFHLTFHFILYSTFTLKFVLETGSPDSPFADHKFSTTSQTKIFSADQETLLLSEKSAI